MMIEQSLGSSSKLYILLTIFLRFTFTSQKVVIEGEEDDRNPQVRWSWKETQTIVNFPNPCNALAVAHLSGCC